MRRRDMTEAVVNAVAGLGVSWALVAALRALGWWDAPAAAISAVFFVASVGRSYALRRVFRRAT
jgi:hypothetical protein